ncbi:MAG TPA: spermidine/putrescine ABC transporter substrate-binding protein, partial [Actinomycetota bacterium]|nr:spermidine/putrescine ABC transporter substrate-binding protein [Actinomycetota bacterium]
MDEQRRLELQRLIASQPRRMTRRDMLRRMGAGAGALSMAAWLAACGVQGEAESNGDGDEGNTLTTNKEQGELNFANWPAYIDKAKGESPTLQQFEEETGISVNYQEVVNDNLSFFGTIREPLANGQPVEWDLIVVTDWLIGKMA